MSLIKVKVIDTEVRKREGVSTKGKPYSIRSQENIFVELNGEVRKVPINLADDASAFAPGQYTIDPSKLLMVGRFGFEFDRFRTIELVPVPSSQLTGVVEIPRDDKKPVFGSKN